MGVQDDYQYGYLDDDRRFADQINGALFGGRQVVKPEELEQMEPQIVYLGKKDEKGKRKNVKTTVDKARLWKGRQLHILVVENQTQVDHHMVLRNMLSESLGYHKQWKQKYHHHLEKKDLRKGSDEFLSGMKKEEKFTPIITLVVYFGTEHPWDGARCLYELLNIDEEMKEYITNYRLNLYDCQAHDTFEEYHTGLRQVFETARYAKDKERLRKVMEENREIYSRLDGETREMMEVVANVKILEEYKVVENGEERYDMCQAFMDMRLEGYEEGITKGIERGIRALIGACKKYGASREEILEECMESFELTREKAEEYMEEHGKY